MPPFKKAKHVISQYGISPSTLRSWATDGIIPFIRTPGGTRLYDMDGIHRVLGNSNNTTNPHTHGYIYARVSSSKQRGDLERQVAELKEAYPEHRIITDIASGINFKRKGLRALLERVNEGVVKEIVVMYRDRLARFGCDLLEFIFSQKGCRLLVHRRGEGPESTKQLAEDLMVITTVFVASHHEKRAAENRRKRKRKEGKEGAQSAKVQDEENISTSSCSQSQSIPK